jgi:hypothetical protein
MMLVILGGLALVGQSFVCVRTAAGDLAHLPHVARHDGRWEASRYLPGEDSRGTMVFRCESFAEACAAARVLARWHPAISAVASMPQDEQDPPSGAE